MLLVVGWGNLALMRGKENHSETTTLFLRDLIFYLIITIFLHMCEKPRSVNPRTNYQYNLGCMIL
jgi:hypothetical protein